MRFSDHGEQLYKRVTFKVFAPGNKAGKTTVLTAKGRAGYTAAAIDDHLLKMADYVERQYPGHEYRLVPIGPASFSFVWKCAKEVAALP